MKELLFNAVGILLISICLSSCSKKDDDDVTPITKEEIANDSGEWAISGTPEFIVTFSGYAEDAKKVSDTLKYLFRAGDKYTFNKDLSCTVTRNGSTAPRPKTYSIEGNYLVLDGYIKFQTNVSANQLTLTQGTDEIRAIVKKELEKKPEEYPGEHDDMLKIVTGNSTMVLKRGK
ncbi:MAG: hypothetical protein LBK97_06225 [Prevotellaceae bacterium]|jgi:hypothetical protein|nr:hypothetical protein [Prevotellaceae bacterium]